MRLEMSAATDVRVMPARFASSCGACGGSIRKGADIRYVKGLAANHEACGDPQGVPMPTRSAGARRSSWQRGGYSTYAARCTHEDYPCCGCES